MIDRRRDVGFRNRSGDAAVAFVDVGVLPFFAFFLDAVLCVLGGVFYLPCAFSGEGGCAGGSVVEGGEGDADHGLEGVGCVVALGGC